MDREVETSGSIELGQPPIEEPAVRRSRHRFGGEVVSATGALPLVCVVLLMAALASSGYRSASATPSEESRSHVPDIECVAVQPLGDVRDEELDAVEAGLRDFYGVDIQVLDGVELPDSAWYEPRRRWRAERLLDFLEPRLPADCDRIIGVTRRDISTTKGEHEDWGILGLANLPGRAAVVSSYRCHRRLDDVSALERLRRVAIHELGHTFGLHHCPTYGCFLEDAGGTVETIDRETFLCDICRRQIGWVD